MPNYSSSSVSAVDWAMGVDGCQPLRKRNLLENLQILSEKISPAPPPPPFQDFINVTNVKKRAHACITLCDNTNDCSFYLPHQTSTPLLDHTNYQYAKIRARPIYNFKYNQASIWTHSSANSTKSLITNLQFDVNIVNKFFAKENKSINMSSQRVKKPSMRMANTIRSFQILDKTLQITADVTMRHLLQLLTKNNVKPATLDDVLRGIDTGKINSEWLQCVLRLNKTLDKHLEKRPDDRIKLENYDIENIDKLNLVESFFVKLLQIPKYSFKLKCYQYRDELQSQLNLLSQLVERFVHGIGLVLQHEYLPGVFQILCYLYNTVSNKSVPALDLISLIDALNSSTNQSNKTVAHVLAEILYQHYPNNLLNLINDQALIELKTVHSIRYEKIYQEIRDIHKQYQQLDSEYSAIRNQYDLPDFIASMLAEAKVQFERLFQQEVLIKNGEQDLAEYFCSTDLTIDVCLSTIGLIVDKLKLAHVNNIKERKTISYRSSINNVNILYRYR